MDIAEQKSELRRRMRVVRRQVASDGVDRSRRSAHIWDAVLVHLGELAGARQSPDTPGAGEVMTGSRGRTLNIMLFESLSGEPDTTAWVDDVIDRGWAVFTPEVDGPRLRVMPGDLDPHDLDAVVVPGLAFTPDGHRLGQGGGHYDRFLRTVSAECLTVGVCFREQLVDSLPTDGHDVVVKVVCAA